MKLSIKSLEHSPEQWFIKSDHLWSAAQTILNCPRQRNNFASQLYTPEKVKEAETKTHLLEFRTKFIHLDQQDQHFRQIAAMLRSMSIEAEFKGGIYARDLAKFGHVDNFKSKNIHDLRELAKGNSIELTNEEEQALFNLEKMYQFGRYPVAYLGKGENRKGYWNHVTAPYEDFQLRYKIMWHCRGFVMFGKSSQIP